MVLYDKNLFIEYGDYLGKCSFIVKINSNLPIQRKEKIMKSVLKKFLLLVIVSLCLTLSIVNTSIFAATVVPTDYTTIYTNTNNDITSEMKNNFGVFKFSNYGARFLKITLTATREFNLLSQFIFS